MHRVLERRFGALDSGLVPVSGTDGVAEDAKAMEDVMV